MTLYFLFRGISLAVHKHLMHLVEQQFQLHCNGSSVLRDTASLSAVGGLAREVIACGPASVTKVSLILLKSRLSTSFVCYVGRASKA